MSCRIFGCQSRKDKIGVLIAQLGTPDDPTPKALKRYLRQFLSDRRVIEVNPVLWWFILNGIVLLTRPARSARLYARIWTGEGSPLLKITERQTAGLAERFRDLGDAITFEFGMRVGNPSLERGIDALIERGCGRILVVPMYPQYSAATTASTYDAVFPHLLKRRWVPTLRVVEPYFRSRPYIEALARTINDGLKGLDFQPERLILSFHGVPESYAEKGDPYCCMCTETAMTVRPLIEFPRDKILVTFQSRFGREEWLKPYTDGTVEQLGKEGVKRIAVACPGFTADCLETLDEIGNELLESFHEHGGESLKLIPSVNDQPVFLDALADIVRRELGSWIEPREICPAEIVECPTKRAKELRQAS